MNLKKIVTLVRLQFTENKIAATIVAKFKAAKAYAEEKYAAAVAIINALTASDIAFTNAAFSNATDNVAKALVELMQKATGDEITFEKLVSPNTGKLATYRFTKGTGAGAVTMDIDIEKDLMNETLELVTIVEGTGADEGKYFDGQTEVGASDGVTGAGVYMKYNTAPNGDTAVYKYADMSNVIEYLTVGDQTNKVVTLTIDSQTHTITADIADGAIAKAKLAQSVQDLIDGAAQIIEVNDIKGLTNAQCAALRAGDIVVKSDATGKHAYKVSFKCATGLCLTYADCENVETVAYEFANENWAWDSTDVTPIGTALQASDLDEVSEADCTSAWEAAMAAAEAAAAAEEEQNGGE